jgi:hypothetical protein
VYGVRETLAALREAEPKLKTACLKSMRTAAQPMVDAINAYVPTAPPLSGFGHNGRTGWGKAKPFRAKTGGRYNRSSNTWPLLQIRNDSAPVAIFDMAANGQLGDSLTGRYGSASRAAWRADSEVGRKAQAAILAAVEKASREVNVQLLEKGA